MHKIVLTEPFIRHPAGLVFELSEETGVNGWDEDARLRERLNFSDKRTYHLPDGGNGTAYELPVSYTLPCPPEVFENVDLSTGPCRLTRAAFLKEGAANDIWNPGFTLFEMNGLAAQGFQFPRELFENLACNMGLYDVLRQEQFRTSDVENNVDCSDLLPGFYQLRLTFHQGEPYYIHFIKSFPLLVMFTDRHGRYNIQKTLY